MYLLENFEKVYAAPIDFNIFFAARYQSELAAKTQAISKQPKEIVDFEELLGVNYF